MELFLSGLFTFLPIIILAFLIRWVRLIKVNSDIQVKQNEEIISLLKKRDL